MPKSHSYSPKPTDSAPFDAEAYVQQTLKLLALEVSPKQQTSVVENFKRVQAIAQSVLDFPLPDDLEAASQFGP